MTFKKLVGSFAGLAALTAAIVLAVWLGAPWAATAGALAAAAAAGCCLFRLWRSEEERLAEAAGFREKLRQAGQEMEACRKSCAEEQAKFYSTFSHGIRMPVSIIKGYAELLGSGKIDKETESQYLEKIIQKSQDIADFFPKVQESLELRSLSSEEREPVDLVLVTQECVQEIQRSMSFNEVRFQVIAQTDSVLVTANHRRINDIIYNLMENASKYMQRPGIVTFLLWRKEGCAHLVVKDDGMGLPRQEAEHIFEKNYQGSNQKEGHGYGLYWVWKIVDTYGGRVSAKSDLGQGMEIHIVLPESAPEGTERLAS